jgi:hypothetical protein
MSAISSFESSFKHNGVAQIPGARSSCQLNFELWRLISVGSHVTLLVPRILRWLLYLWQICAPLKQSIIKYILTPNLLSCPFPGGSPPSWTSQDSTESVGGSWEVIRMARMACSRCHVFDTFLVPVPPRLVLGERQPRLVLGERQPPAHGSFSSGFISQTFLSPLPCKSKPSSSGLGPETRKCF